MRALAFSLLCFTSLLGPLPICAASWCMGTCYSAQQCGQGCACLRSGLDVGRCVSLNRE